LALALVVQAQDLPADVPPDHWAAQAVQQAVARGWLQGYPDGQFRGGEALNRYQLALILARFLAETPLPPREAEVRFTDVPPGHWALAGIRRAVGEGLVQGFPDQTYRGNSSLTRYQLTAVLGKLMEKLGLSNPPRLVRPADLPPNHWAEATVLRVVGLGIMPLDLEGRFRGEEPVSRYQMAYALWRLSQLLSSLPAQTSQPSPPSQAPQASPPSQASQPPAEQTPLAQVVGIEPVGRGEGAKAEETKAEETKAEDSQAKAEGESAEAEGSAKARGLQLGQISRVRLPEAWAGVALEEVLVHLGQSLQSGKVWATLRREGEAALALLGLAEGLVLEAFYPLPGPAGAGSEG